MINKNFIEIDLPVQKFRFILISVKHAPVSSYLREIDDFWSPLRSNYHFRLKTIQTQEIRGN